MAGHWEYIQLIKEDKKSELLIHYLESKLEFPSAAFVNQLMQKLM